MKNRKIYIAGLALAIVIVAVIYGNMKITSNADVPIAEKLDGTEEFGIIYYFGKECPHCVNVQKFLDENKIAEKVMFTKKEVWHNAENAIDLNAKAEECGLDKSKIGVPFLYANGKCFVGEIEVENFFKNEAAINS